MQTREPLTGYEIRTWDLWSTVAEVHAPHSVIDDVLAAVESVTDRVEMAASRFRPDSDISRVNAGAGSDIAVGATFLDILRCAMVSAEQTRGLVDPTVGAALVGIGYDRDIEVLRREGAPTASHSLVTVSTKRHSWRDIEIDDNAGTVRVPRGVVLDLGSCAKAWASDQAAIAAWERVQQPVLVGLGGDIRVEGVSDDSDGFVIRVTERRSPEASDVAPCDVAMAAGGMATSSTLGRAWFAGPSGVHHLIDPRTAAPARSPIRTATVVAATCVDANTASTAAIILGDEASAWLRSFDLPARLVTSGGEVRLVGGWPA